MQKQNNDYDMFFWLSFLANVAQLNSYLLNIEQVGNDDLMKHLLKQDKVLDEQTKDYLKKIIEQNDEILKYLRKENQ